MKDFKRKLGALCLAMSALTWSLPNVARAEIVKQEVPTVYKSGVDKIADACEGYTQQSCDVVTTNADGSLSRTPQTFNCCGKKECQNMLDPNDPTRCKVSRVFAHGSRDTCTEPEQVSPCGKSCCGKEDCASVCNNYRLDVCKGYNQDPNGNKCCGKEDCEKSACGYWTVTTEDMGTPGIACCGYLDCANKACGGYTYTESKVFPDRGKIACCGKEDCEKRACGGILETTGAYGGLSGLACCGDGPNLEGTPNCRLTECQNQIETTSISDLAENKKKLECCGPGKKPGNPTNQQWGNCWQVHCDNYISTVVEDTKDENGKNGTTVDCCGYLDCLEKQCSGRTSVVPWGKGSNDAIQCCGNKECDRIYTENLPKNFDLQISSSRIDYEVRFNANIIEGVNNMSVYTKGDGGSTWFWINGLSTNISISHWGEYPTYYYPYNLQNISPYAYMQYKDPYQSFIMPLNRNTSFRNKEEDTCYGESTCYECSRPSYTCLTSGKVHGNLNNRHLFVHVDDVGPDGKHTIHGLPVRFTLKNRDYNCTWRDDPYLYHLPDVCSTTSCANGMPMDLAKSVCSQPYNYEDVTFTNYKVVKKSQYAGSYRYCTTSSCYECGTTCSTVEKYVTYYVQEQEQRTVTVPTDVCSIQTTTANYPSLGWGYDRDIRKNTYVQGAAVPIKKTTITCDVPASYQSLNREPIEEKKEN